MQNKCLYCGKSLVGLTNWRQRKYCSASCGNKLKLRIKKPGCQSKLWQHEPEAFERAMEMYWRGLGGVQIARRTGIPSGTIYSWIHDFGAQREREMLPKSPCEKLIKGNSIRERFVAAKSADEWREVLLDSVQADDIIQNTRIHLVCGKFYGHSVKKLTMIIFEKLKDDPLNGQVYAFCSKCGDIITTIAWYSPIFNISRYIKTRGTFVWPQERLGVSIEITRGEFEKLISLQKDGEYMRKPLISCGFHDIIDV